MDWKDLAPWIAISITLAISILVPLFTQIANNNHQRKMQREKLAYEQKQKKVLAYEEFLSNVGAAVLSVSKENLTQAGASINRMYIYAPEEWWEELDSLSSTLRKYEWGNAAVIMNTLSHKVAKELQNT